MGWWPRYRSAPPKTWELECDRYLRKQCAATHAEALEVFGLGQPIPSDEVSAFLRARTLCPRSQGEAYRGITDGSLAVLTFFDPLRGLPGTAFFPTSDAALVWLRDAATRLCRHLRVEEWQAVTYLLCGTTIHALPWIEIERADGPRGTGFTIYVGSIDATAEEVRRAYAAATKSMYGEGESERAPRSEEIELFIHELDERSACHSWEQSWQAWATHTAPDIGATPYDDANAYRNKVESLRRRFRWMREELDAAGRRNDAEYLRQMRGGEFK